MSHSSTSSYQASPLVVIEKIKANIKQLAKPGAIVISFVSLSSYHLGKQSVC